MDWVASTMKHEDTIIQRGVGAGLRFNPGGSNAGYLLGLIEFNVQRALQLWLRPGMTVYDVGANVGFITMIAARLVGRSGRVIAIEPVPALADEVWHNARLNGFENVSVIQAALGDIDGQAEFALSQNLTMGRLADSKDRRDDENHLKVKLRRLDTLAIQESLRGPDLVKVDAEGAEVAILDGATELLSKAHPMLLIELHTTNQAVGRRLDQLGYVARALEGGTPIKNCAPNACVAAVPKQRDNELARMISALH